MRFYAVVLIVFALTACATPMNLPLTQHDTHYQPNMNSGKGFVYIYRERNFRGSARGIFILANGKRIGGLNNGTYFVYEAEPGDVVIAAENTLDINDSIKRKLSIKPHEFYFIRGSFKEGAWDAMPYIEIVTNVEGEQAVQQLSYQALFLDHKK